MKTKVFNQSPIARITNIALAILIALFVAGIFHTGQTHAEIAPWCGPQSVADAYSDTLLLLEAELEDLDAQYQLETDPQAQADLLIQINNFLSTIAALYEAVQAYTGPCMIVEEECPVCNLAMSECPGHEELCPTCNLAMSECPGHEELCPTCSQAVSQCYCPLP